MQLSPAAGSQYQYNTAGHFYGGSATGLLATIVHPNDYIDGAVLRPHDYHYEYRVWHAERSYIMDLYRRHGKDLCFIGVVVTQHNLEATGVNLANQLAVNLVCRCPGSGWSPCP